MVTALIVTQYLPYNKNFRKKVAWTPGTVTAVSGLLQASPKTTVEL